MEKEKGRPLNRPIVPEVPHPRGILCVVWASSVHRDNTEKLCLIHYIGEALKALISAVEWFCRLCTGNLCGVRNFLQETPP